MPALLHGVIRGALPFGDDQDQDESLTEAYAMEVLGQLMGTIPVVREAGQLFHGHIPNATPAQQIFETMGRVASDVSKAWEGEPLSKDFLKNAVTLPGYFGAPTTLQYGKVAKFLWDYETGRQEPETPGQWLHGVLTGEAETRRRRRRR